MLTIVSRSRPVTAPRRSRPRSTTCEQADAPLSHGAPPEQWQSVTEQSSRWSVSAECGGPHDTAGAFGCRAVGVVAAFRMGRGLAGGVDGIDQDRGVGERPGQTHGQCVEHVLGHRIRRSTKARPPNPVRSQVEERTCWTR